MKPRRPDPSAAIKSGHAGTTRVSVVIPAYNRAHTLSRALDSVTRQTYRADEVIVVDDGSTDQTAHLIHNHYPDIHYIRQPNRGVSAARNTGIQAASGEWIALLDSDDAWQPDKLARQCALISRQPDCQIVHCNEIWIRNGRQVNPMKKHRKAGGDIFNHCLPLCAISPSATVLRKDLFTEIGGFDESLPACEDYELWLRICSRYPVHYIDEPLVIKYGGHADQLSKQHWGMDRFRIQALDKLLRQSQLHSEQRRAALMMLQKKCAIYRQGAARRGRHAEVERLQRLLARHEAF